MKRFIKIFGILIFIISFWMVILGGCFSNMIVLGIGFYIIIAEAIILIVWSVRRLNWQCTKCKTVFSVTWKQNVLGLNGGSVKELYCPHCEKKAWCKPVKK